MKKPRLVVFLCILVVGLNGCQQQEASSSVSIGPFEVNSESGLAGGKAFGVDFKVAGASRSEVSFELHANPKKSSRATITLADDLNIELETRDDGETIVFHLNGIHSGDLKKGDQVEVNEEGVVTINGSGASE